MSSSRTARASVRFAEPEPPPSPPPPPPHPPGGLALFRLPKISASLDDGSTDVPAVGATAAIYNRHGYSPPRSPSQDTAGYWKYPLPSKSFRVYVGPPLRHEASQLPASRGSGGRALQSPGQSQQTDVASPGQLQRSRTEPAMSGYRPGDQHHLQRHQRQPILQAPFVQSRAEIFLRRRQPQPQLYREATGVDEAERLRWTMSTQRHWQADRKGQQRNQGPFSREFTVHVTAPSNWMHMKWGRKQRQDFRPAGDHQQVHSSYMYTKQAFGHQPHHHGY